MVQTKLFSDPYLIKFLDTSAKSFFSNANMPKSFKISFCQFYTGNTRWYSF